MISVSSKSFEHCVVVFEEFESGVGGGFSGALVKGSLMHITQLDYTLYRPDLQCVP